MSRRRALVAALAALLLLPSLAPVSLAFIPKSDRTLDAIAATNRTSGRAQALQLELLMRVGEREPVAAGTLITHPSGLARLELRGFGGRVDRYPLSGGELLGAKDGFRIERPQPMLQPLFLMQPSTGSTLRAALQSFEVASEAVGLSPCGDQDCFVIGDPRLAAPLSERGGPPADVSASPDGADSGSRGLFSFDGPELAVPDDAYLPRLWVDTETLQVRRIDRANGVFTVFGPIERFDRVQVPGWFEIHEPGQEPFRFEVESAVPVNAPATAFGQDWLLSPVDGLP